MNFLSKDSTVDRRQFLQTGAACTAMMALNPLCKSHSVSEGAETSPKARSAIFINLNGGPSQLDSFDPKPDAPREFRGEFAAIQTSLPGIIVSEHLPLLAANLKRFALLRGISHSLGSHSQAAQYVNPSSRLALLPESVRNQDAQHRESETDNRRVTPGFSRQFGTSEFGISCLKAVMLVESGVRFVTLNQNGWDTHRDNWNILKTRQLPVLDQALSGLVNGLAQRGLLDSTIVCVAGEFGRTPKIVAHRAGRDHYPGNLFMLLAGGGVRGGQVIGESNGKGFGPVNDSFCPADVACSIFSALRIDHLLPRQSQIQASAAPRPDGRLITALFS